MDRVIFILFLVLISIVFPKDKEYRMEIYGDCYYFHLPTKEICLWNYFWDSGSRAFMSYWSEFFTKVDKDTGKVKYLVRYVYCRNGDYKESIRLYIYMTPEDIKLCNQKPEPRYTINVNVER